MKLLRPVKVLLEGRSSGGVRLGADVFSEGALKTTKARLSVTRIGWRFVGT